jgi:hypothetical protein
MRENDMKKEEIFSKVLRAGRRTYFFDVRATKQMIIILQLQRVKNSLKKTDRFTSKNIKYIYTKKIFCFRRNSWRYDCLCFKPQRRGSNFRKTSERFQKI